VHPVAPACGRPWAYDDLKFLGSCQTVPTRISDTFHKIAKNQPFHLGAKFVGIVSLGEDYRRIAIYRQALTNYEV
jgi:hypothetical protein